MIVVNGRTYSHKTTRKSGTHIWMCVRRTKTSCNALVKTIDNEIFYINDVHRCGLSPRPYDAADDRLL